MTKKIEEDIEELSVNIFVNEYGALRTVYNRLYTIIHVYYSSRRQLVTFGDTLPLEKILYMRKDMAMRLERVNALTKDEQFPQENFEVFAREKLEKMNLAIGLLETAKLMGELSAYSETIMDYMRSCCEFASKFITVLSDPGNQNLKVLKNNLATLLEQIDTAIKQSQSPDQGRTTVPLSGPLSRDQGRTTVPLSGSPSIPQKGTPAEAHLSPDPSYSHIHQGYQGSSKEDDPIINAKEALNILEKIDLFKSKSRELDLDANFSDTNSNKEVFPSISNNIQDNTEDLPNTVKFQQMLDEKYGFHSRPDPYGEGC